MEIRLTFGSVEELAAFMKSFNTLTVSTDATDNDWPGPEAGKPARSADERPPWEPDDGQAADGAESNAAGTEADPWADDKPSDSKPAQASSDAPGVNPDDDPWS